MRRLIEQIDRAGLDFEELGDFWRDSIQYLINLGRLAEHAANRIQREQFPVAAANFHFCEFSVRYVQQKTLIGNHGTRIIAGDEARFVSNSHLAIAAAELKLKIAHLAVFAKQPF